jgi:nucleoside-diphosphate-sugar epimerase
VSGHALLFGASGFLGAHVRAALEQESSIEWVSCLGRDRCDLVAVDVEDLVSLVRELAPTVVVNCTGRLDGTRYQLMLANTLVTAKLIDAVERAGPGVRLIRLGSAGEYGPVPFGSSVSEDDLAVPVSEYALSHLAATRLVELAGASGRVDGVTLRVFNPIGPGLRGETLLGRAAARLQDALVERADVVTMGPLSAYRDFVDARDVARAVVAAVLVPTLPARVVNVGSGRAVTARAVVELLAEVAGFAGEIREAGAPSARSAAVAWIRADITRAADALGWHPSHELADSVRAIWTAHLPVRVGGLR